MPKNSQDRKEPQIRKRFNPLNDYIFQRVMGEKGDEEWLLAFINAVLERTGKNNLTSIEIVENKKLTAETIGGKSGVLDVRATTDKGEKVNIEVQLSDEKNLQRRSLYYWAREYAAGIDEGDNYEELPTVFAINIVDFGLIKTGGVHTSFHIREDEDKECILSDALEIHFLDMSKFRRLKNPDVNSNIIHRWLTFFDEKADERRLKEVIKMDASIAKANEKMIKLTNDPEVLRAYDMHILAKRSEISRIQLAEEKGIAIGKMATARSLKSLGSSPEFIAQATGLSIEEIEALK
ncbi:MAG: Rpn family recombination-promoting nuclease/putative transposase [Helicobacteraceae bacterium]|jgi:predicted transposase/invertase (TIGR01784 family)|nr:Rpn family recombination-promoting nuclease/putative transposase [Helicobacteraceae bacterium]